MTNVSAPPVAAPRHQLDRRERELLAYLIEENRVLREQVGGRRMRLTDDDRRKIATRAHRLARQTLRAVATIVSPDSTIWATAQRQSTE